MFSSILCMCLVFMALYCVSINYGFCQYDLVIRTLLGFNMFIYFVCRMGIVEHAMVCVHNSRFKACIMCMHVGLV
jgi:hypothetical protein